VPPLCLVSSMYMCNTSVWLPYRTCAWTAFTMSSSMAGTEKQEYMSEDDDFDAQEGSSGTRQRRQIQVVPGAPETRRLQPDHVDVSQVNPTAYGPGWPWMGGPWMHQQPMVQHPWVLPSQAPPLPYPNPWRPPAHAPTSNAGNPESAARAARRQKRNGMSGRWLLRIRNHTNSESSPVGK
jgi:hypothetical protein